MVQESDAGMPAVVADKGIKFITVHRFEVLLVGDL